MRMGTAQKQNISTQHRYFNNHGGRQIRQQNPVSFKEWFFQGIEKYSKQGVTFEVLTPGLIRIKRPGKNAILRTFADFQREYKEYLSQF